MRGNYNMYRQTATLPAAGQPSATGYGQSVGAAVDSMRNMHVSGASHLGSGHVMP
jgi:hypothetical protein